MLSPQTSRRSFLKRSAAFSTVVGAPWIVPATALGRDGRPAPSERIVMGCIGTGGQGIGIMKAFLRQPDVQVIAVCDVEREANIYYRGSTAGRDPAQQLVHQAYADAQGTSRFRGCEAYVDFRELLANDDIDAVTVTTPDHWHALASVAAANAGKDIYCEKPLANSVAEGRAICQAVERNGRLLQTGSHERANDSARFGCELVRNGRIGELKTVRIQMPLGEWHHQQVLAVDAVPATQTPPDTLDYDFWLGHTATVPYTPKRCHFWWRFILAYGGGEMTDRGAHVIDLAQLGMGTDHTGPVRFEASGSRNDRSLYDAFMDFSFVNTFANGVQMIGEAKGPRGVKFEGTDGWVFIHVHGGKLEAEPASLLTSKIGEDEIQLGRSPGHQRDLLDCMRSRELPLASAEIGHRTASICHLNNIAMLTGRTLDWDPEQEQIVGDPEANAMLKPNMRAPWTL